MQYKGFSSCLSVVYKICVFTSEGTKKFSLLCWTKLLQELKLAHFTNSQNIHKFKKCTKTHAAWATCQQPVSPGESCQRGGSTLRELQSTWQACPVSQLHHLKCPQSRPTGFHSLRWKSFQMSCSLKWRPSATQQTHAFTAALHPGPGN